MEKILELYKEEWNFLKKDLLKIFLIVLVVFIVVSIISGLIVANDKELSSFILQEIMEVFENKDIAMTNDMNMVIDLFVNNVVASLMNIAVGIIPFLILPIFLALLNSVVIGGSVAFYQYLGFSPLIAITLLLPHGIIEIPAYILSVSLGIYLSLSLAKKITIKFSSKNIKKANVIIPNDTLKDSSEVEEGDIPKEENSGVNNEIIKIKDIFKNIIRSFALTIIPLLIIAAFIETFLTTKIADLIVPYL